MTFRPCAVVPSRNHYRAMGEIVAALRMAGLPVIVVDDGSEEPARTALGRLHDPDGGVTVVRFGESRGKGGAVCRGFELAAARGFTHVVQIDADGQHDVAALPRFLELAEKYPGAVVSGQAVFDSSAPSSRRFGRWITHVWVWIETLSCRIPDTMCGFRVYPLDAVMRVLAEENVGKRMDFDTDIVVRLFWRGVPVAPVPVRVTYPPENVSNFDTLGDNWRITKMHTRLVLTMLVRLPDILRHRPPRLDARSHWASLSERGLLWGLLFSTFAYRLLGRTGCLAVLSPVVLYFFLTGREQRVASREFLARVFAARGATRDPGWADSYRHFMSFAGRAVDSFAAWDGRLPPDIVSDAEGSAIGQAAGDPRGALFIVSHLGNADLSRALLDGPTRDRMTVLVHTRHALHYNEVLRRFNPAAAVNTLQVTGIGPETTIDLRERIERGEWVVIAGDRTPIGSRDRVARVPFLGKDAAFAHGPFILGALLGCPVYLLFCLREGRRYRLYVERMADRIELPRDGREEALTACARRYAARLEHYAMKDPLQWYNFFDFWA